MLAEHRWQRDGGRTNGKAGSPGPRANGLVAALWPLTLCLLVAATYLGLYGFLWTARYSAWLSGPVLSVRGAFTTRCVDLAVSTVRGEIRGEGGRFRPTVHLVAIDTVTGRKADLCLGTIDHIELNPQEMDALSDAVLQGARPPDAGVNNLLLAGLRLFYRRPAPVARYLWADPD